MPAIDFEARRPWLDRHLDAGIASGTVVIVAELQDGGPAGFVTVDPRRGTLDQLAVDPEHQGTGVADALMAAAKALSPVTLDLDVNRDNARALRFYARHGFQVVAAGVNATSKLPTLLLQWRAAGEK